MTHYHFHLRLIKKASMVDVQSDYGRVIVLLKSASPIDIEMATELILDWKEDPVKNANILSKVCEYLSSCTPFTYPDQSCLNLIEKLRIEFYYEPL